MKIVKNVPVLAQFVPLREVLEIFFELSDILDLPIEYQNKVSKLSNVMANITQGYLWKQKAAEYDENIVLPYTVFFSTIMKTTMFEGATRASKMQRSLNFIPFFTGISI